MQQHIIRGAQTFFHDLISVWSNRPLLIIAGISLSVSFLLHLHLGGILFLFPGYYESIIVDLHRQSDLWGFVYDLLASLIFIITSLCLYVRYIKEYTGTLAFIKHLLTTCWHHRVTFLSLYGLVLFSSFSCWELIPSCCVVLIYFVRPIILLSYYILLGCLLRRSCSLKQAVTCLCNTLQSNFGELCGWLVALVLVVYCIPYLLPLMRFVLPFLRAQWLLHVGGAVLGVLQLCFALIVPVLYVIQADRYVKE